MKNYKELYEKRFKTNPTAEQTQKNKKTINNYKAKLAAGGVDVDKATDDRNFVERLLNLDQNQGLIGDIFEIINRPQEAIFSGWKASQEGGDFLEGAKEGLLGNEHTQFKDILMNYGMEDRKGKLDLVDVAGFAGDVFLDPLDWLLVPVTGGASLAAGAVDTASDASKAIKAVDKTIEWKKASDALFDLAGRGVKKTANVADTTIEKGLKFLDESKGTVYKNPTAKWASDLGRVGKSDTLEKYKGLKNNLTNMFNTKLSSSARKSKKVNDAVEYNVKLLLEDKADGLNKMVNTVATKLGKNPDDVAREIQKVTDIVDEITLSDVIEGAKNNTIRYSDDIVKALNSIADDVPDIANKLKGSIKKGKYNTLELGEDWFKNIDNFNADKLSDTVKRKSWLTKAEIKEIDELTKFYNENAPEIVDAFKNFYTEANDLISEMFPTMKTVGDKFNIKNISGYAKHKQNANYVDNIKKLVTEYGVDPKILDDQVIKEGISSTGSKTLNARKYNMSANEANMLKKRELLSIPKLSKEAKQFIKNDVDLFDTMATAGVQEYINNMPKYAKNTQMIDEVLIKQGFGDISEIDRLTKLVQNSSGANKIKAQESLNNLLDTTPFRVVENGKPAYGFEKLDGDTKTYLVNFIKSTGNKIGNSELINMAEKLNNLDNLAIDPTVLNIIKVSTDTSKKNEFLGLYDKLLNFFKGTKTFSVTNQMNNITGNMSNMMLSGMNSNDIVKYVNKAFNDIYGKGGYEEILKRGLTDQSKLNDNELKIFNRLKMFESNVSLLDEASLAEKYDIGDLVTKVKGDTTGEKARYLFGSMARLNGAEDRVFKYALFSKAFDDPNFAKKLGVSVAKNASDAEKARAAAEVVNKVLFDPRDLTYFENKVAKRVIPFYTFAKKNLAFHIDNLGKNGGRYYDLMKGYDSLTSGFDENLPDYLKENMYIPLPSIDEDGNYKFIRARLPFGDLINTVNDPWGAFVDASTPLFKLPYELKTGVDSFTGREIESFPGEKSSQLPFLTKKQQKVLSDITGLDVPIKTIYNLSSGFINSDNDNVFEDIRDSIVNTTTITRNVDTDKLSRQYEEIEELQNIMKQYQQEGYEFSTMNELKKANKNGTIAGIKTIFAKYGIE